MTCVLRVPRGNSPVGREKIFLPARNTISVTKTHFKSVAWPKLPKLAGSGIKAGRQPNDSGMGGKVIHLADSHKYDSGN
jgi:hypothetical protein